MSMLRATSFLCVIPIMLAHAADAGDGMLRYGAYEIVFRLELPHLERWAVERKTTVCVSEADGTSALLPILSGNNPFAGCQAKNVHQDDDSLTYDIICNGRDAAKAQASYVLVADGFHARIAMTMGAKNMTMTEVQSGRRLGSCLVVSD